MEVVTAIGTTITVVVMIIVFWGNPTQWWHDRCQAKIRIQELKAEEARERRLEAEAKSKTGGA